MAAKIKGLLILFFFFFSGGLEWSYLVGQSSATNNKKHKAKQLVCQLPPKDAVTGKLIMPSKPIYRSSFAPLEAIWVAIDINIFEEQKKQARIYVIHKTAGDLADGDELKDVSCGYEEIAVTTKSKDFIYISVWKSPNVSQMGYDVIVDFSPFGFYNKGNDILDGIASGDEIDQRGFVIPKHWVYLESISFNYDEKCHCRDAINIRKNWSRDVKVPEWKNGLSFPAAYIKDREIKVKVTFLAAPSIKKASIATRKQAGILERIWRKAIDFKKFGNINRGESEFEVMDRTPGEIRKEFQHWRWYCRKIILHDGTELFFRIRKWHLMDSINKMYIVLTTPQFPWCLMGGREPWTEVLDFSCKWADGAMTPEEAVVTITKHLYCDLGGSYCREGGPYTDSESEYFKLTLFMNNIAISKSIGNVNCSDMGKALVIFANAVGCNLSYWETIYETGCLIQFNNIVRIGEEASYSDLYYYHGFGGIHGRCITVFDACFRKPSDGNPPKWLTNISWDEYQTKMIQRGHERGILFWPFNINNKLNEKISVSSDFQKRMDWLKIEYNYKNWKTEFDRIIAGISIFETIPKHLQTLKKVVESDNFSIEKVQGFPFVYGTIRERWKSETSQLITTMVVGTSPRAVKQYLLSYYSKTTGLPLKRGFKTGIGDICLVPLAKRKNKVELSRLEFIRNNVLFIMKARGEMRKSLEIIARKLDSSLKMKAKQNGVKKYSELKYIPTILSFLPEKKEIKLGDQVGLNLEINNPGNRKLQYLWEMTGGGIEKDNNLHWAYYGGNTGNHTVTVIVINDLGLYDFKSFKIKVLPGEEQYKHDR